MSNVCIIRGHKPLVSETFLDAHVDRLRGDNVVLYCYFPEYTFNGRTVRYFYSRSPWLSKAKRLLPQFVYDRFVTRNERSTARTLDFMSAFTQHHNVGVILAEYGFNGADITPVARALNLPLVVHFHGHDAHRESDLAPYRDRYQEMFSYAKTLISVSNTMTDSLVKMGAPESKIVYNPYGAREHFFDVQPDYRKTLIAVGRFADIKAPYLTLMAFREALQTVPDAKLVMVGDGPLLEACRSMATTWDMEANVTFTGALPHDQVLPMMSQACAFVQHSVTTSYGDMEGMPNSILEAGAAALPVISTRHAGISTSIIEGETGLLVDERDVAGMAANMCRLLTNPELCRSMGTVARQHIKENYHINRHIACLQQVINQARGLGEKPIR
jgi:colanic acid/amylovoran biosynthesis glycosyltransferase